MTKYIFVYIIQLKNVPRETIFRKVIEVNEIINAIINNGAAVGLLIYFVFRDYKYISDLTIAVNTLQITVNELRNDIEVKRKVIEDDDNTTLF